MNIHEPEGERERVGVNILQQDGQVLIDFKTPIEVILLDPSEARTFARSILKQCGMIDAVKARRRRPPDAGR